MRLSLAFLLLTAVPLVAAPPNVVLIIGDDMAWTDYGFMGHPHIKTPHLDRLAREGAAFANGSTPTSLCRASLATLLTGRYAHEHKICCNDPPKGVDRTLMHPFIKDAPTVPRLLAGQGYASLQTGKFWEGHFSNGGFTHGMTEKGRHGDEGLAIGRKTMQPVYDFITAHKQKPFFVWYAPMMPHMPHDPPERILARYRAAGRDERIAKYWAMCEWFDETVGQLLDRLDQEGLSANTLVLYVADNGWIQSSGPPKPGEQFLTRSKNTAYDAGVRTPILIRWPGRVKPGQRDALVSTLDIAPTILTGCGVTPPAEMTGLNLLSIDDKKPTRDAVFGEIFTHDCKELGKPELSVTHRWVRQGQWKLIRPMDGPPELFDLAADPYEKTNRAEAEPARVEALTRRLDEWWSGRPRN